MVANDSTHAWLGRFAGRLMQLRPLISMGSAIQCAVSSFHQASEIEPLTAAEIFAQAHPALAGGPGTQPQAARYRMLFGQASVSAANAPEVRDASEAASG